MLCSSVIASGGVGRRIRSRRLSRGNILVMTIEEGNRPGLEEIRTRILELRHEIEELRKVDQEKRLSRQSQVSWDAQRQHEARVARMDGSRKS
jgi:hypothetical protein